MGKTTSKTRASVATFKKWARANVDLAAKVLVAREFAKMERERVDAYIAPVFATFTFLDEDGNEITDMRWIYQCQDDDLCSKFFAACDKAHREHGFTGSDGYCPALIAEHDAIKAENALIAASASLGLGTEAVTMLDDRAKLLEILLGACSL